MCFPGPSKNDFFRSQDRSRTPKSRRIDFFGSFLAPPLAHFGATWAPKSALLAPSGSLLATLGPPGDPPGPPGDPPGESSSIFHQK